MSGYSTGGGGGRYFIGGSAGEILVTLGLMADSFNEGVAALREEQQRGEALLARRNAGEALDEVDTEILEAYLSKKTKLEEEAQAALVKRTEQRRRELEQQAYLAAAAKRNAAYARRKADYAADCARRKADYAQAMRRYDQAVRATGRTQAKTKSWWVQFSAVLVSTIVGMIAARFLGL